MGLGTYPGSEMVAVRPASPTLDVTGNLLLHTLSFRPGLV